ncbi:hypothetical protein PHYBLDRAFT_147288 [Phycomyces blakesleeanus NRRL 1555(-)]|uniref:Uncharacterized protein n=1 Tax=Phycomyces blakesleeanus (strain ATCC 8743b / DSM 1359 / FGSC 10004 / NBRC 33097 / NRRL 1555) TaxID=763407 RepID=A0A162TWJ1_PHYB8|nr:hypothetical protein PHYBLDRAFT_147288 [Phycomyces blakesleeanus NRRL 1555(-)]OAD71542.1 hypothetical protein PHYBLDRAFT_147288 [Phycomyces blakesleeanus NRRL 1555(-)]|eukprot:XP_018289582.1 hypothetical protein PHYBLDRAFT_147288 [Phycomyces blakesleeanus NRRL 1555(-)]
MPILSIFQGTLKRKTMLEMALLKIMRSLAIQYIIDYSVNAMEINKVNSYKCGCSFEDTYRDIVRFVNTIILDHGETILTPGVRISPSEAVDDLLQSKSSINGHEYNVCSKFCILYGIGDKQKNYVDCGEMRYKTNSELIETPIASMKLLESVAGQITDIFDVENYKKLVQQGLLSNPNDIAIGIYTDGFISQKVHGLVVECNGVELCRSKVYLLLASGDIPVVAYMAHFGSHNSLFGRCSFETKGKSPNNSRQGTYLETSSAPLRPLEEPEAGMPINSFDKVSAQIDGTRAVYWLHFILYLVPTLVAPHLPNRAVKGCVLALQWTSTSELLDEIDAVFRSVQPYLVHTPYIIKQQDPLKCDSAHSMKRVIGIKSNLIKSKSKGGRNPRFIVRRFVIHNHDSMSIGVHNELDTIQPKSCDEESYMDFPNDLSGARLGEPFY